MSGIDLLSVRERISIPQNVALFLLPVETQQTMLHWFSWMPTNVSCRSGVSVWVDIRSYYRKDYMWPHDFFIFYVTGLPCNQLENSKKKRRDNGAANLPQVLVRKHEYNQTLKTHVWSQFIHLHLALKRVSGDGIANEQGLTTLKYRCKMHPRCIWGRIVIRSAKPNRDHIQHTCKSKCIVKLHTTTTWAEILMVHICSQPAK